MASSDQFFRQLEERVSLSQSLLCIGLDPHITQLSDTAAAVTAETALEFCLEIVRETYEFAAAFKPNCAFFECFGAEGIRALKTLIAAIPRGIPVILDCKRGDIDTTAQAYASAAYDVLDASCVTLSPYMGWDSIKPFVTRRYSHKGAFVLCKTSNPSSQEMQCIRGQAGGSYLYEEVVKLCDSWNALAAQENDSRIGQVSCPHLGVVVGATDLKALDTVRRLSPSMWILCPGVGAQGGEADLVCGVGLREDGSGLLVSVSRAISKLSDKKEGARQLRDAINVIRESVLSLRAQKRLPEFSQDISPKQKDFIQFALQKNVLQFGRFTLKSGRISPYFFNAGLFYSGLSLYKLSRFYAQTLRESGLEFDVIFGPAYKGIPLSACIAMAWYELYGEEKDVCYNRKEVKDHGEGGILVGAGLTGRRVVIVDDVITAGTAIREAVDILKNHHAQIIAVVVSLDRQERVNETSLQSAIQEVETQYGFPVLSIVRLIHLISYVRLSIPKSSIGDSSQGEGELIVTIEDIETYRTTYGVEY